MSKIEESIGALWLKRSKSDVPYLSGEITIGDRKIRLVVFKNKKSKDTHPDYKIFESKPMEKKIVEDHVMDQY